MNKILMVFLMTNLCVLSAQAGSNTEGKEKKGCFLCAKKADKNDSEKKV